jgi:hypothetical protein
MAIVEGQASGSSAEIWYKIEESNGVLYTEAVGGGLVTTLSTAANPGDTQIVVVSDTNAAAGDVVKVSDSNGNNMELFRIRDDYAGGTTITLETGTTVGLRHESGEAVTEVDATTHWFKLGNITNFVPTGERSIQISNALSGTRLVKTFREGNYTAGADITAEIDLTVSGLLFMHALNCDYNTVGTTTAGATTTLDAAATRGDLNVSVTSETGFVLGEYAEIGAANDKEVIKIGTVSAGQLDLDTEAHPLGLRKDHANGVACDEVIAPFTHTIVRGNQLPPGISFLLRFTDINKDLVIRGNRISSLSANLDPGELMTMTITTVAKGFQMFTLSEAEDIFGTAVDIVHTAYVHHEGVVQIDDTDQVTNLFENMVFNIENSIVSNPVLGSPLPGRITPGAGSATGSFTYQFEDEQFALKTIVGTETKIEFNVDYTLGNDTDHELDIISFLSKITGNPFPGAAGKDPVTDSKSFTTREDGTQTIPTDVEIRFKNNQPTVEWPVDTEIA